MLRQPTPPFVASTLAAATLVAATLSGWGPQACAADPAGAKLQEALDSPTQLEFIETPLEDVVEFLRDLHEVDLQFDKPALAAADRKTDEPVSICLSGVSLRSGLDLMLHNLGLAYVLRDRAILITTPEAAKRLGRPAPKPLNSRSGPTRRVIAALRSETELEMVEAPLQDVIDFLMDLHDLAIQVDHPALKEAGVDEYAPVSIRLKGVSLHAALRITLRELGLIYAVAPEYVLITTPAGAEHWAKTVGPLKADGKTPAIEKTAAMKAREEKIRRALGGTVSMEFVEADFRDVLDYLRAQHDVPIVLQEPRPRRGDGSSPPPRQTRGPRTVTRSVRDVSLRSALEPILADLDLTHEIRDEVLLIRPRTDR